MRERTDVCLITTSELSLGIRSLSSYLGVQGRVAALGLFDSWGLYTQRELDAIVSWVRELSPSLVGVSSIEFTREKAVQLLAALRPIGIPVVVGGADPTLNCHTYLRHADYVIRGEGEQPLDELCDALSRRADCTGIPNLCYRDAAGAVVMNPLRPLLKDLDALPFEDWDNYHRHYRFQRGVITHASSHTLAVSDQVAGVMRGMYTMTIRGCSYDCSFCVNHELKALTPHDPPIRMRSLSSVINNLEKAKHADPGLGIIYFFDDDFFLRSFEEISFFASAWKSRINVPFYVNCTPLSLDAGKLQLLVDAGLKIITMGIQSGSERITRDLYQRKGGNDAVIAAARLLSAQVGRGAAGLLPPLYDLIINNPYETEQDLLQTIALLRLLPGPFCSQMHSLKLFQGTALYRRAARDGLVTDKDTLTKYNCHDTLPHFDVLIARGGNLYLNALLYWMNGIRSRRMFGIVPAFLLDLLTHPSVIALCNRHRRAVAVCNAVLPTQKRLFNLRDMCRKYLGI